MALRGRIEDFGIADLLQLLVQGGKAGVITLSDDVDEVRVAVKGPWVVGAENTQRPTESELASRLATLGVISGAELGRVLKRYAETEEKVASILVEGGFAPRDVVRQFATLQLIDTVFEVFTWPGGAYAFEEGEVGGPPAWLEPVTTDYLLMHAIELVDEWPRINATLRSPSLRVVRVRELEPALATGAHAALVADLMLGDAPNEIGEDERRVYELCRPGNQVKTVLERMPTPRFDASRALVNLIRAGFVRLE